MRWYYWVLAGYLIIVIILFWIEYRYVSNMPGDFENDDLSKRTDAYFKEQALRRKLKKLHKDKRL